MALCTSKTQTKDSKEKPIAYGENLLPLNSKKLTHTLDNGIKRAEYDQDS